MKFLSIALLLSIGWFVFQPYDLLSTPMTSSRELNFENTQGVSQKIAETLAALPHDAVIDSINLSHTDACAADVEMLINRFPGLINLNLTGCRQTVAGVVAALQKNLLRFPS